MGRKFLNPDNPLMITLSNITDCIFLSLFWLVGCIPVVTAGASFAALYDATHQSLRKGSKHSWSRFLHVYRKNWKAGILPTLVFCAVIFGVAKAVVGLWNNAVAGELSWMLFSGCAFLGILVVGIISLMFPMLSRFENSFAALLKNTLFLALANLPRTVALGMVNTITGLLCAVLIVPLFFLPSLAMLVNTFFIEPMFKPYMPKEDAV